MPYILSGVYVRGPDFWKLPCGSWPALLFPSSGEHVQNYPYYNLKYNIRTRAKFLQGQSPCAHISARKPHTVYLLDCQARLCTCKAIETKTFVEPSSLNITYPQREVLPFQARRHASHDSHDGEEAGVRRNFVLFAMVSIAAFQRLRTPLCSLVYGASLVTRLGLPWQPCMGLQIAQSRCHLHTLRLKASSTDTILSHPVL